ncbi:MAG: hypothetical protein J5545_10930 [Bacteroidaceae bacterium]|nr:hypothetical protein [Bacteroidaceae bacterium]
MATLSNKEIAQLQQELKEKVKKLLEIYDKLAQAGVMEMPDDILDAILMDDDEE